MIEYVLLTIGAFLAAAISGSAGFGDALMLLPLLTETVGVSVAVPLLTIVQLVGNASRAALAFRAIRWRPVLLFLAGAVPLAIVGALSFAALPKELVVRIVGVAILAFVVLKAMGVVEFKPSRGLLVGGGAVVGLLSGLVGSAGPLGAAVFLSLNLPPLAYVSSEATAAIFMHGVKSVVYGSTLNLGAPFWPLAAKMSLAMIAGTWAGKLLIECIPANRFRQFVMALLALIALEIIIVG